MDLQKLRAAAEKATPGPYIVPGHVPHVIHRPDPNGITHLQVGMFFQGADHESSDTRNAAYFALCDPATVLALLDYIEASEPIVARLIAQTATGFHKAGNAPGHAHDRPGIWDDDNGDKAGAPCDYCRDWKRFGDAAARLEEM